MKVARFMANRTVFLALLLSAGSAWGQGILRVSVAPHPAFDPSLRLLKATLNQAKDGSRFLALETFDRRTGFRTGSQTTADIVGNIPQEIDVMVSTVFMPGSVLVVLGDGSVRALDLSFKADGTPVVISTRGFGVFVVKPRAVATVIGEAPNARDPSKPLLAIGTSTGEVITTTSVFEPNDFKISDGPIDDLGPIAQLGFFALGAVSNGTLFLIDPLGGGIAASLRDPRNTPLIDFGSPLLGPDSKPLASAEPARITTANGTAEIAILEIPTSPTIGGKLEVKIVETNSVPVKQVVFGSISYLSFDGSAVLYNPAYSLESGFAGRIWTLDGASMEVVPGSINVRAQGRFLTVPVEVANNGAARINVTTLAISVDGIAGSVPVSETRLEDIDGDLNLDLVARLDRQALITLLQRTSGRTAILRTTWQFFDGEEGQASAQVRVIR